MGPLFNGANRVGADEITYTYANPGWSVLNVEWASENETRDNFFILQCSFVYFGCFVRAAQHHMRAEKKVTAVISRI